MLQKRIEIVKFAFYPIHLAWTLAHQLGRWLYCVTRGDLCLLKAEHKSIYRIAKLTKNPFLVIGLTHGKLLYCHRGIGKELEFGIGSDIGLTMALVLLEAQTIDAEFAEELFHNCCRQLLLEHGFDEAKMK